MALIDTVTNYDAAVWWAKSGTDRYGNPSFATPVEIDVRWTDLNEMQIRADGTSFFSKAKVFVDRDVTPGDILLHSELDSSVDQDTPLNNSGAYEVQEFKKVPNKRATKYLRKALL